MFYICLVKKNEITKTTLKVGCGHNNQYRTYCFHHWVAVPILKA